MNEFTVRFFSKEKQIDPNFVQSLESIALQYGYQAAQESASEEDSNEEFDMNGFIRDADAFSKRIGPHPIDSADLIREDRDRL